MSSQATVELAHFEAYLEFLSAAGIDCAIEDEPVDRFELSREQMQKAPTNAAQNERPKRGIGYFDPTDLIDNPKAKAEAKRILERQKSGADNTSKTRLASDAVIPGARAINSAREAAGSAKSLEELRNILSGFDGCNLRLTAKNLVFGVGDAKARVMFVGEAPGRDEDIQGIPFVGRSGQLLDRMLKAAKIDKSEVYIANVVPWRPPGNRTPTPQETEICRPFIQRQIELVDPEILVFLGAASATSLTGQREGIRRLRGRWLTYKGAEKTRRAIAMFHPAYLLRSPAEKRFAWKDILTIHRALETQSGGSS